MLESNLVRRDGNRERPRFAAFATTGKWADTIAVEKNPIDDVRVLQDVKFVMKGGVVYKGSGARNYGRFAGICGRDL
jgi:hypothetical protein